MEIDKKRYCSSGGCPRGKLFATNWLEGISDGSDHDTVEVTFKNTRNGFYTNPDHLELHIGDIVAVRATLVTTLGASAWWASSSSCRCANMASRKTQS